MFGLLGKQLVEVSNEETRRLNQFVQTKQSNAGLYCCYCEHDGRFKGYWVFGNGFAFFRFMVSFFSCVFEILLAAKSCFYSTSLHNHVDRLVMFSVISELKILKPRYAEECTNVQYHLVLLLASYSDRSL